MFAVLLNKRLPLATIYSSVCQRTIAVIYSDLNAWLSAK